MSRASDDRSRLHLPASRELVADLEALAARLGTERSQLGVVALALGLQVLRTGTGLAPTGAVRSQAGTAPDPDGARGHPSGAVRSGTADALSGSLPEPASKQAAAAAPEGLDDEGERPVPACGDRSCPCVGLDWPTEDLAQLHAAAAFRIRERALAGEVFKSPAAARRFKLRDFLDELDDDGAPRDGSELEGVLARMEQKPAGRRLGRDPT